MATPAGNALTGQLFSYMPARKLSAFRCGPKEARADVVLLGGLSDGLLPVPWTIDLANRLEKLGMGVVQPVLTSSLTGWGIGSLDRDAEEVEALLGVLQAPGVVLLGHSTGCQDSVHALWRERVKERAVGAVLQAPVSDRPGYDEADREGEMLAFARRCVDSGRGDELMPKGAEQETGDLMVPRMPVTAFRYSSLAGRMGQDDYFSHDLTREEMEERVGHIDCPLLLAPSEQDECVPEGVDQREIMDLLRSCVRSPEKCTVSVIEGGDHALSSSQAQSNFLSALEDFLARHLQ